MSQNRGERLAWFNGDLMPESEVRISFRDLGWLAGDTAFDVARTFGGKPFKLREHVDRLYRTLAYLQIDPGMPADEMCRISNSVIEANAPLRAPDEDYWVGQRISRGLIPVEGEELERTGPTIVIDCMPLPFTSRALDFRDGIEVVVPSVRRTPPDAVSPRAKMCNYINVILGDLEAKARNPRAWAILLDTFGNIAEGMGSNFFLVRDGALFTPKADFVLPGISRETVMELADDMGIECHESDVSLFDACNADEAFLTSTSLCLCAVRSINGVALKDPAIPGPVTARLTAAFRDLVGFDFVGQVLRHLPDD
jgi:branched-chain amino acid aminotransferase